MSTVDEPKSSRYSRRGFLKRAGAGAGAVAMAGGVGAAVGAPRAVAARSGAVATAPTTFGRLFPDLAPFPADTDSVKSALRSLGAKGGLLDAQDDISAGPSALITDPAMNANSPNHPTPPD